MELTVFTKLINHLPYLVFWKDLQSNYLGCNEKFARVAGLNDPIEIIGKSDFDLAWKKEEAEWYRKCDRRVMDNDQPEHDIEETQQTAEGKKTVVLTSKFPLHDENGHVIGMLGFFTDITENVAKKEQLDLQKNILKTIANGVLVTTPEGIIRWVNPAVTKITGYSSTELVGSNVNIFKSGKHDARFYRDLWSKIIAGEPWHGEIINKTKDGELYIEDMTITPLRGGNGEIDVLFAVKKDISEKKELQSMLAQTHRLESIGQLAAGIAHEINTPTQYVGDNARFLRATFNDLTELLNKYREISDLLGGEYSPTTLQDKLNELAAKQTELDVDFLLEEIPHAIDQTLDGISRIESIVRSMKEFSHPGDHLPEPIDIRKEIASSVAVAQNEWKYDAEVEIEINEDDELKKLECIVGDFKQVILNIVVNAAQAIKEKNKKYQDSGKGKIRITCCHEDGCAVIRISDTGIGIPEVNISKIYDPFFTTKKLGEGTGQGLNIVYHSITKRLNGTIQCESQEGVGTLFTIRLPLKKSDEPDGNILTSHLSD
jgi:PAS domain S-box-containing protein